MSKPMTKELRETLVAVLRELRAAYDAVPDSTKGEILKAAGLSYETVRRWGWVENGVPPAQPRPPAVRSLVALAGAFGGRLDIRFTRDGQPRSSAQAAAIHTLPGGSTPGAMMHPDDWDDLSEEEKGKVRGFIQGVRSSRPPPKPGAGRTPGRARKK